MTPLRGFGDACAGANVTARCSAIPGSIPVQPKAVQQIMVQNLHQPNQSHRVPHVRGTIEVLPPMTSVVQGCVYAFERPNVLPHGPTYEQVDRVPSQQVQQLECRTKERGVEQPLPHPVIHAKLSRSAAPLLLPPSSSPV
jgi:hypothetical protein